MQPSYCQSRVDFISPHQVDWPMIEVNDQWLMKIDKEINMMHRAAYYATSGLTAPFYPRKRRIHYSTQNNNSELVQIHRIWGDKIVVLDFFSSYPSSHECPFRIRKTSLSVVPFSVD